MSLHTFGLCFVPLFIAVDAIGALPVFISLTHGVKPKGLPRLIISSAITAAGVGLLFVFVGEWILRLMGITVADFMVAGGCISLGELVMFDKPTRRLQPEELGAVPIGVPLIVGPGVLTTVMLLVKEHGLLYTGSALLANVLIAGVVFSFSTVIIRVLGKNGTRIISKIASLLLAAIAVMIIRRGIFQMLQH